MTAWKKILRWEKCRPHITAMASQPSSADMLNTRAMGTATTLQMHDEEQIALWVQNLRSEAIPINRLLLKCTAMEVGQDLGFLPSQFKASSTWISGFIKRWKLSWRAKTRSGQSNHAQGEATLAEISQRIRQVVLENEIDDIYNADQTGINFEYIPKHTFDARGAKTVWIRCSGHDKDRMTAMLLADTKGTKYPMFLVLKTSKSTVKKNVQENLTRRNGFGPRVWPEIVKLHERHASRLYANPTAWWNRDISIAFLEYHFGHRKGKNLKKVLLLWDDFSAHFGDEVVAYASSCDVMLEKIPPTFTWICQPADVSWMKPMKAGMRQRWVSYLREEINHHSSSQDGFRLLPPTRSDLVEWVNDAWENLPRATVVNGFVKCNIIDTPVNTPASNADDDTTSSTPTSTQTQANATTDSEECLATLLLQMKNREFEVHELESIDDIVQTTETDADDIPIDGLV
ncbi:hypothetical protein DYB25_012373 [Aphanomyces astaci]|uniref:HTH CENPB-type domain-containing protein n=1 Tax=Aphanomyces astaci TaxID=112090 RepID=A0A396ZXZ5_APHAT|nr:hypothetical protein DYB25_012373 [Aphanomyces astaci]